MDRRVVGTLLLCLGLLCVAAGGAAGTAPSATDSVQDTDEVEIDAELRGGGEEVEVLVSLTESDSAASPAALQAHASQSQEPLVEFAAARQGVTVETQFWVTNAVLVTVDTDRVALETLASVEGVDALYENGEVRIHQSETTGQPGASDVSAQEYTYGLEQINVQEVWNEYDTKGAGASVAVLDTGVDASHPDLNVTEWQEFDSDGNPVNSTPNDGQGHGTHVSGTVSGAANPAGDVATYGVAPEVDLYGVKVLGDDGGGSFAQIIAGMEWATEQNVDVISMSLGATGFYDQMIQPVRNAVDSGTTVVTSAGNSGEGSSGSPGNVYDAISVGASTEAGDIAGFSSGEQVSSSDWSDPPAEWPDEYIVPSVSAPGSNVLSSVPGGGYDDTYSGTSMAAPHVAGVVALAESVSDEELSPTMIEQTLEEEGFKPGDSPAPPGERDIRYGSGIVDALGTVSQLEDPPDGELVSYTVETADIGDSLGGQVFVEDQPGFDVEIQDANSPVEGDDLEVTVGVENMADAEDTQTLALDVGALGSAETNVTLTPGETVTETFTFGTGPGDEGDYTATATTGDDSASTTVTVLPESSNPAGLELQPTTATVPSGSNTTLDVVLTGVDEGVVAYSFNVSVGDTDTAEIAGYTLDRGQFDDSHITGDNQTLSFEVALGDETYEPTEEVTVATVEVAATGEMNDSTPVEFEYTPDSTVEGLGDMWYTVTSDQPATVEVNGMPTMPGAEGPPMDHDGDDLYEDVDGSGTFNIFDVQMFFENYDHEMMNEYGWAFDFNGDGTVDIFDVQMQFEML